MMKDAALTALDLIQPEAMGLNEMKSPEGLFS